MYYDVPQNGTLRVYFRVFSDRNRQSDEIGATVAVQITKNGAAWTNCNVNSNAVPIGNSWYYKDLNSTDLNTLGPLAARATGTHLFPSEPPPFMVKVITIPAVAGDAMTLTAGERTSIATAVWANATRSLSTYGTLVADIVAGVWSNGTRSLTTFGSLVSDIWAAVVDAPGVTTLLARLSAPRALALDNLDAAVSSRLASTDTRLNHLDADISSRLPTTLYEAPANDDIADILTASAHLDVDISSRLAAADYTAPDNTTIAAIKDDTEEILATGGGGGGGGPDLDDIKAKVVEALSEDAYSTPGQEELAHPASITYMLAWLYKLAKNKLTQTNTITRVWNEAGDTVDQTSIVSDDGTTFTRDSFQEGP